MPNYAGTRKIVEQFLKARVPLIVINSVEPKQWRFERFLRPIVW